MRMHGCDHRRGGYRMTLRPFDLTLPNSVEPDQAGDPTTVHADTSRLHIGSPRRCLSISTKLGAVHIAHAGQDRGRAA
jgi:hypothetical protein